MTKKANTNNEVLSDYVEISRQFLRSVRVDTDLGREDALHGYICQGTARSLLESMANQIVETKQRAFTWTGPYGGGKSSLALVLCSLVSPNPVIRKKAQELLELSSQDLINKAFPVNNDGWMVLPVVGRRESVVNAIDQALNHANPETDTSTKKAGRPKTAKGNEVIARLVQEAESQKDGVLLVIDELGKFLESAAQAGEDIYFYQELAEAASRSKGRLVVIGILHQAFEQYAARLGREARNEWAKVQGRYIDIPLVAGTDEVIELVSRAISFKKPLPHPQSKKVVTAVVDSIRRNRPGAPKNLEEGLDKCWPLHPITASLLGPISKRRFGQNERSTFGFLASREPIGFTEFLTSESAMSGALYGPARYWDYLKANLEPSILASPDGHKWSVAADAIERAEVKGSHLHANLVKAIALIEMFKNGSGLVPENEVLQYSLENLTGAKIKDALSDLEKWSIIIYRKHLSAWGIYSGSDFDIDAATIKARAQIDSKSLQRLSELSELFPVIAKRLYQDFGTMRWFSRSITLSSDLESYIANFELSQGSSGEFILVLPNGEISKRALEKLLIDSSKQNKKAALILGIPSNAERIAELGVELIALEGVKDSSPELEGDNVARREINGRISLVRTELEEQLRDAFALASWYYKSEKLDTSKGLSNIASYIAESLYPDSPKLNSELINRDAISSNAKAALRDLLHRMLTHATEENLGYESYPADAGLYYTVIKASGLHNMFEGVWRFTAPQGTENSKSFKKFWKATTSFLSKRDETTTLEELYDFWASKPLGIRRGVMPALALVYFLANRQHLAMYIEGVFEPELSDAHLDEWLQDERRIGFRYVEIEDLEKDLLGGLATALSSRLGYAVSPDPLDSARGLVALAYKLPQWTQKTSSLSPAARDVRQILLHAKDPHKVLFTDLPTKFGKQGKELVDDVVTVIQELTEAYPEMLRSVEDSLFKALDHDGILAALKLRVQSVKGIMGDYQLEAFALRLESYNGFESLEALIGLAANKRASDCLDQEINAAILQLGKWAHQFRTIESLASVRGRSSTRKAIAVVFGAGQGHSASDSFDVAESDIPVIDKLANELMASLSEQKVKREILLAALAEAGTRLVEQER
jgi:hypothetical protein